MFGLPADSAWIWVALVVASAAMFGLVTDVGATPPDAERVADAIDDVAASSHPASGTVEIDSESIQLSSTQVGLRGPGGRAHASVDFGPITPVRPGSRLDAVLDGRPPDEEFAIPGSFEYMVAAAQDRDPSWREAGPVLRIRYVEYGEVNSVLVGA